MLEKLEKKMRIKVENRSHLNEAIVFLVQNGYKVYTEHVPQRGGLDQESMVYYYLIAEEVVS